MTVKNPWSASPLLRLRAGRAALALIALAAHLPSRPAWALVDGTAPPTDPHLTVAGMHRVKAEVWTESGPHPTEDIRFYLR